MEHTLEISPNLHVTEKKPMIYPRLFPAALVLKDRFIFLVSGSIICPKDQDQNMVDCYDIQENLWFSI